MDDDKNQVALYDVEHIQKDIYTIRGMQVMLDSDLAALYGVETKVFNQAVKRNIERFPINFRFKLTRDEYEEILRSQFVTSSDNSLRSQFMTLENRRGKYRTYLPYAFTEQGVAMLSAVLRNETASMGMITNLKNRDSDE